jgi:DNA modification methylase
MASAKKQFTSRRDSRQANGRSIARHERSRRLGRQPIAEANHAQRNGAPSGLCDCTGVTAGGVAWEVHRGDVRKVLATLSTGRFHCAITSPPYFWQRDYDVEGQLGKEAQIEDYVTSIVEAMRDLKRVMRPDGLLFLNLGDTYYSAKGQPTGPDRKNGARRFGLRAVDASGLGVSRKTIIGIPWRVAIKMIDGGWTLRCPIVWQRSGSQPEPTAKDRPWRTYEMIFMFSASPKYYFSRPGLQGDEDIWNISARPKNARGIHSAAFPEELVDKCLKVGCPEGGEVIDPFAGSGTVLRVALRSHRPAVGIDLSARFCEHMARELLTMSGKHVHHSTTD